MAVVRLGVLVLVVLLFTTVPVDSKNILRSVLTDFDAQLDEVAFLMLLTNEGPTDKWFVHEVPDCGGLYLVTPEMELNGGNPCPGGVCETPIASGTNLTGTITLEIPYLVYLFRSEDLSRNCSLGDVGEILIEEYLIPENITLEITYAQNANNAPIAFGESVSLNGGTTATIELEGSIDVSSSDNYQAVVLDFDTDLGSLTNSSGSPIENGIPFSDPTVIYTPPADTYSSGGTPLGQFSFQILGDSALKSNPAEISLYVNYLGGVPIVPDFSVRFKEAFDNVFEPVEVETDGPPPTEYTLTALPPNCDVYEASDGYRVGSALTGATRITDQLIFYCPTNDDTGTFQYTATDADGNTSPAATVNYEVFLDNEFPQIKRCLVNVAESSSTVIDFRNADCVGATTSVTDLDVYNYYILEPPTNGELYIWEDGTQGDRILPTEKNVFVESGQVLFVNDLSSFSPSYAEIRFTASATDAFGNPGNAAVVVNVITNIPPFIPEGSVAVTVLEDTPTVVVLNGLDFEGALLFAVIDTLPTRGTLNQYDPSQPDGIGEPIAANENDIFTQTRVTDSQNRVIFTPSLNEFGENSYTTFTYLVNDGIAFSNLGIGSIAVTPVPDDPVSSNSFYTVEEVSKTIIQLDAFDPESDDNAKLTFELLSIPISSYGDEYSGLLFQTDQFENYDPDAPILNASLNNPVPVSDPLGRLVYVAADVPVQFNNNGSRFFLQVDFDFRAVVPAPEDDTDILRQESNISSVFIQVLGVNNPPFSESQDVTTMEDTPVSITLRGSDMDMEDQDNLIVYISEVPQFGVLSQWVNLEETQQFEIIQTAGISVSDPQRRVIYIPNENQVGDPLDSFSFVYFDGRETSFSSEVTITVLCENDAPELGDLPENVKAEDGTDIVIYLGGTDVDANDPLGYCFGDFASFEAVIASIPNEASFDFSKLYQYIDADDQGLTDPDRQGEITYDPNTGLETYDDGTIPIKQRRGPAIDRDGTIVTDPLRRVIFAAVFTDRGTEANSSVSQFSYFFQDAVSRSQVTDLDIEVRVLGGVDPSSYGDDWKEIISYLIGVLVSLLVMIFICIALSIISRKPQVEENEEGWIEFVPDENEEYEQEIDDDDYDIIEKRKSPLEEILLQENLKVVTALCDIVEVSEFDEVAAALVAIFESHHVTLDLIKKLISKEVHDASSAGTLFRRNSMASKVMTAYSKKIGHEYLETTLTTPITHILDKDFSFEVDPRKVGPGEDRKQNMKLLLKACENFFVWITTSGNNAPPQFKTICYHLFQEVNEKFPQNRHSAVGGFLFLRFFCPAIISPDGHGIKPEASISVRSRRCFVLVAKALQNLSNGLLFGQKENFMMEVNSFIEGHKQDIIAFFEEMSREEMRGKGRSANIDPVELAEALNTAHRHLYLNIEEIQEILNQNGRVHNTEGTLHSEVASKMTDGLTTFLHTQSHLSTSDISGLTALTTDGTRSKRGAYTARTNKSRAATAKSGDTWMDWAQDSDKTDKSDFTFGGGGSDLEGPSLVDTENIDLVPFEMGEDEITDFDLSSHIPDTDELSGDEHTSLVSTGYTEMGSSATASNTRSRRGGARRGHAKRNYSMKRMSRRSQMTMTGTDVSVMSSYGRGKSARSTTGEFGEEYFDERGGGEEEEDDEAAGREVALQLMKVLDDLGTPPGL